MIGYKRFHAVLTFSFDDETERKLIIDYMASDFANSAHVDTEHVQPHPPGRLQPPDVAKKVPDVSRWGEE
jgi:hypothetical protein